MRRLLLLCLFFAAPVSAQSVTPNFTTGTLSQTVTSNQTVTEVINTERFGGAIESYSGDNVQLVDPATAGADVIISGDYVFEIIDGTQPWQLEILSRQAGLVETEDITRTINVDVVTNSLSVFSQ